MKKIVTALANATLNTELKKYAEFDLYEEDLFYQDAVMNVMESDQFDILIVSALLQGQYEFTDFVEKIRKIDGQVRVIVITDEINSSFKRKLVEVNVTDIFLDDDVSISEIIDAIQREVPIRKKFEIAEEKEIETINIGKVTETEKIAYQAVQKQEIIAFSGINGAGKSTISANFARVLAGKTSSKVLLMDMDTLYGNIDEILEINKVPQTVEMRIDEDKKCGLNYAAELIDKNRFDGNVFEELVIHVGNIDVLTGNTSLHYCQNILNEVHYNEIIKCAKERYDFIIMDVSSNIFLDATKWALQVSNRIFFVTENNYISMKKSIQLLNTITEIWKVWKNKIEILVNKENPNGIDLEVIKKVLKDYEMVGKIRLRRRTIGSVL